MVEQQKTVEANKGLYFYMSIHDQDKIIEGRKEGILIGEVDMIFNIREKCDTLD